MANVEIYTKAWCGYCARARKLLDGKGVEYQEYDITMGGPKREEMLERAPGRTTVPQIFIDGRHIGGSDDLMQLDRDGKLDELLGQ
ncbi:MAG: glutaredoxin 3 [Sphingobium sp.]|uniref:glutaredoxin 3 n=1 Tax=Sphingobium sp. TaxID=1912891 RepID=UPI000DB2DC19|nr:glutaredoxin 3 [Sphingobium sp.]PZU13651.1 MAG: glutaredoxin 3 [Sphingobium sp.]